MILRSILARTAFVVFVTALLVVAARAVIPAERLAPDFICFWSAAELMAAGESPYDTVLEAAVQRTHGWNKTTDGIAIYDCLPYFYPPWFAMLFLPLLPLGYTTGKVIWMVLSVELLVVSGLLLRDLVKGVPRLVPVIAACTFALSVFSVLMGQTPPLILFLMVANWWLLSHHRDWSAGAVLAWVAIKPQLAILVVLSLFVWAVRQRRWGVIGGFCVMVGLLAAASTLLLPGWLMQMLSAPRKTPLPTDYFPWYGTTWLLVGKSFGLQGWRLWGFYLAAALPLLAWLMRLAWKREKPLGDLFALAILATFFVTPYGQPYDFAVLLIPVLVLMGGALSELASALVLVIVMVVPYVHIHFAPQIRLWWLPPKPAHQITLFWVPLFLTLTWLASRVRSARPDDPARPSPQTPEPRAAESPATVTAELIGSGR